MSLTGTRPGTRERLLTQPTRRRRTPSARRIALRRFAVLTAKLFLPLLALLLLASIAAWPEIVRMTDQGRVAFRRVFSVEPDTGRMREPRYHGIDQRGRPYTITAAWASQAGQHRLDLGGPKGDLVLEGGQWLQIEARDGVFIQHADLLDLSKDVVLYRDDGLIMRTQTAAVDIKQGAASSNDKTHAEGPFGVLDAQGFTMLDKGTTVQFQGPARLILNGGSK